MVTGCCTFFAPQLSNGASWSNAGNANYHAMVVTIRRSFHSGLGFDLNYTWSHSIDNASAAASGSFHGSWGRRLPMRTRRGCRETVRILDLLPSDQRKRTLLGFRLVKERVCCRTRQNGSTRLLGDGRCPLSLQPAQGCPLTIAGSGAFSTNYNQGNQAVQNSAAVPTGTVLFPISLGNPSLFSSTTQTTSFKDYLPGGVGQRGIA